MSNDSLSSIRSSLDANLSAVTQLKEVTAARTTEFNHFPACRHYLIGLGGNEFIDTATNYRTWRFGVDVVMPYAIKDMAKETAEALFQDAIDAVLNKLDTEWADSVDHSVADVGNVRPEDWPMGPVAVITIVWQAKTLHAF